MSRLMVTGATGFVGRHLCQIAGNCYRVIRHKPTEADGSFIVVPELDGSVDWAHLIPMDVECIVHLAGIAHNTSSDEDYVRRINVDGTLHLAEQAALAGVKRFVFVSSIGVNGQQTVEAPFTPTDRASPSNAYTRSKHEAELDLQNLSESMGFELVIVRPTLVYGPDAPGNFGLLANLVKHVPLLPFGSIHNSRDFITVHNLADLLVTCSTHKNAPGHIFLASDGETVSIKDFTNAIAKGLNKKLIQLPVPVSLMYLAARIVGKQAMAEQLLGNLQVDSSNAQDVLGWVPPYTMEQVMASLSENKK
ncbi:NAD-dependent epimerase/dehydratase family protein [Shewanella sp. NIFS-20-20]|uniref:NAD-dependent epimerase/dehydratase family protein n=1 Tax=Shewanella sp. NIFS-20-20 TaxID=2853806 RepID=UPI001C4515C5|nr:NAD-dependent epimerase/dehydratase family protein [Shewanella sp. NIFS-20-20]MBV7314840.1 NAD-dependent epimerase/dehydratase family protein [Shewanella sp. NIFS-20-20]